MASPGTDAAEGDEGRSTAPSAHATGWRVASVDITESAIPSAWLAPVVAPIVAGASPAAPVTTDVAGTADEPTNAGPKRPRRRWSLGRRRRARAETLDFPDPVDLDLVAMGLDDEDDQAWSELTLASLGEGARGDAESPAPDTSGSRNDPWSLLAGEADADALVLELELESEFWA